MLRPLILGVLTMFVFSMAGNAELSKGDMPLSPFLQEGNISSEAVSWVEKLGGKGSTAWALKQSRQGTRALKSPAAAGGVVLFISKSLPRPLLQHLFMQAKSFSARIVMRGFIEGSIVKTAQWIKEVSQKTGQGIEIDPELFKKYGVNKVPALVVDDGEAFDVIYGSISVGEAFKIIREQGETARSHKVKEER